MVSFGAEAVADDGAHEDRTVPAPVSAGAVRHGTGPGSALRTLASRSRMVLLHHLQRSDRPLPVDALARITGLHVNTTREHLDRLVATGFVAAEPEPRQERGRPRLLYRAVDRPVAASLEPWAREYLERLAQERYPDDAVEAEPAVEQLVALEVHLEDLGFDPDVASERLQVHLRSCPVAELAREQPEITCGVHLRLTRDVLDAVDGPLRAERLEPFVGPEHCVLHLDDARREETANPRDGRSARSEEGRPARRREAR